MLKLLLKLRLRQVQAWFKKEVNFEIKFSFSKKSSGNDYWNFVKDSLTTTIRKVRKVAEIKENQTATSFQGADQVLRNIV